MNNEERTTQLQHANDEVNKGNLDLAEQLSNQVLASLSKQSDSLETLVSVEQLRANALFVIANTAWRRGEYDFALEQAHHVLAIVEKYTFKDIHPKVFNLFGIVYDYLGNYGKSLDYYAQALAAYEEFGNLKLIGGTLVNIGLVYNSLGTYDKALEYYAKAVAMFEEIGEQVFKAIAIGNIGHVYFTLGSYDKALEYFDKALAANLAIGATSGIASNMESIGMVYGCLDSYDKALENLFKALATYEELGQKSGVAGITGNIGNLFFGLGNYDKSLEYFFKSVAAYEELGEKSAVALFTGNIGHVYYFLGSYDKALEFYVKALAAHIDLGSKSEEATVMGNIGSLYATQAFEGYNTTLAEEYLCKAIAKSEEIGKKKTLYENEKAISDLFNTTNRKAEAYDHFVRYHEIKEEVQSEEAKKTAHLIEQNKQAAEREKEIEIAKVASSAKIKATTALLHKVLPESIASRMMAGEEKIADYFPSVSILFADIVGFTRLATEVPPDIVIDLLNYVFDVFDAIMKKNGCEKVKTMGDGYMAVAGAPVECSDHAERMSRAAFEMMEDIHLPEAIREDLPEGTVFNIRIGIHTGGAVCGVMGKDRFIWDVYSDAVNTASRMESNGVAGKIHVSKEFAWLLRSRNKSSGNNEVRITERGEIDIKGKGKMKTYFLEKS
ncbi:MAG: tetratricopeptide repeat protein [Ignavibacteria bacterium]|nr:tetratricopeptide repeat protein [Ignavibacteria bacterium]